MTSQPDLAKPGYDEPLVEPVAIIGMACRLPGARNTEEYWRNLAGGVESVRFFSREEQEDRGVPAHLLDDPNWVPASPMVDDVEYFDAGYFGMTAREADVRDPQQRMFLELAATALQDSGYDPARFDGEIGVYGGIGADEYQWRNVRRNPKVMNSTGILSVVTGNHPDYLATFTSYKLNLRGPSLTVHTACSTSLVALHLACEALRNSECDMALSGGVSLELPAGWGYIFAEGGIMSPDGHCRAFDASSGGTLWGSGGGVLVLKRLSDALADGDDIRAVVLGNAVNNDGSDKVGFSAPSVEGQSAVVAQALGLAGVDPRSVSYVEAHGTGTALGDPIEVAALSAVFGRDTDEQGWCGLGSVKTNIGHLGPAAGVAAVIKTVLALQHRLIPPSLHFEHPHPKIDFASGPFYVNAALSQWDTPAGEPRRAGVSSFGIGGTNAHLVLQEAPPRPPAVPAPRRPVELVQVSARTEAALATATDQLADHLESVGEGVDLADVAFTLRRGRSWFTHRAAVVARDAADAAAALRARRRRVTGAATGTPSRVAFLFSGQGSQYAGMAAGLYAAEPVFRDVVDEFAEALRGELGRDLRELLLAEGEARAEADQVLARTEFTQPALFTVEYGLARLWASWGVEPAAAIGHSIGEYVAATLAGVFEPGDALRLVADRGALMQSMPAGAMLAVQLDESRVREDLPAELAVATVNGPGTCVVAGPTESVDSYAAVLAERGVGSKTLRTSHAFHSPMMEPVLGAFRERVAALPRSAPTAPFLSNVTGRWITAEEATDPGYWAAHLREAVRFGDCVSTMLAEGEWTWMEVGPGRQLAGLVRMQLPKGSATPLTSLPGVGDRAGDLETLYTAAGRLWVSGVDVDTDGGRPAGRRVALPTYPFERRYHWVEPTEADLAGAAPEPPGALPVDDWFAVPSWRQAVPAATGAAEPADLGPVLVFGDGPLAGGVADRLRAAGCQVLPVARGSGFARTDTGYAVRPGNRADQDALVAELSSAGDLPTRIVHAFALDADPGTGPDSAPEAAWRAQDDGFFDLLALAQALAAAQPPAPIHLDVLTAGACDVSGGDLVHPEHATVAGAVGVLPLELPWLTVRHIDLAAGAGGAHTAVAEILREPVDTVVALRGSRRWVQDYQPVRVPAGENPAAGVRPGAVCLVTGGLGGVGISVAEDLARRAGARLVLLSRTPLPDRSEWDTHLAVHGSRDRTGRAIAAIRRMERHGAQVLVLAADVTSVSDLQAVRTRVLDAFGRVDLIVHAAGVPGGGMAEVKERAQAEAVLAPKLLGTLALREVFGDLALDAVVLCSSVTALAGGFGQVDYCAANAFLDALARSDHGFAGRVVSLNWGGWLEVGMAAEIAAPTAFRTLQRGLATRPVDHPVLSASHHDPATGAAWATGLIGPGTHWVLDEHRITGRAVLPGTGHLATVRAAFAAAGPDPAGRVAELRDVVFTQPLAVADDGQCEIRVSFAEGTDGMDFQVTSRAAGEERAHARGTIGWVDAGAAPVRDLAGIRARCTLRTVEPDRAASHSGMLSFGPRWSSLRRVEVGVDEELAWFEASDQVAGELDRWTLHPALLDEATSFGTSRGEGRYLPMGYGRLLVRAPLPARMWSHLRYRDGGSGEVIVADLTLLAEDGTEVAQISEFVLRRVDPDAVGAGLTGAGGGREQELSTPDQTGIAPADGAEALHRMLATDLGPQVAVTVTDVRRVIAGVRTLTQQTVADEMSGSVADERADHTEDASFVAPTTELERVLCQLWEEVLGGGRVGVHDDFFDLGGNSLVAVQLIAQVRKAVGEKLPMRSLFEAPTVAGMAASVERLRAARNDGATDSTPSTITPLARRS